MPTQPPPRPPQNQGWYYATGNPATPLITVNDAGVNLIPTTGNIQIVLQGVGGTTWFFGVGPPPPGLGNPGDFYLDTSTGNVYNKILNTWTLVGSFQGPAGAPGPPGPPGAPGPNSEYLTWFYNV